MSEMHPMMQCGHAANAKDRSGNPSCVICVGIHPGATSLALVEPELAGRIAKCSCGNKKPSSTDLPFFEFMGTDSRRAQNSCKHCGYDKIAHSKQEWLSRGLCKGFAPHGAYEFDSYYCGCRGWD